MNRGYVEGYYDDKLSIVHVDETLLRELGYEYDDFMEATGGSFRNMFYGENKYFLEAERFPNIKGNGEGQVLTREGVPIYVRMYKSGTKDSDGRDMWRMGVEIDQILQNLKIVNNVIKSGMWSMDFNRDGELSGTFWSHEFRKMLGFHDTLDFPNKFSSWKDLLHPEDKEKVLAQLRAAVDDKTNETKYNVEYRIRMADGTYHWFRSSADTSRRIDGTAKRIVGIFVNIDAVKSAQKKIQMGRAFHEAFTESNLCEYYVNLTENTYDSLKVSDSLLEIHEENEEWDKLIQAYLDQFVCNEDRESVAAVFDRKYMEEKLREGAKEASLECRIIIDGQEHWVRNVVLPGDELSGCQYAMIYVRDITEAKQEEENLRALSMENHARAQMIDGMVKLVSRFSVIDFENDFYTFYNLEGEKDYDAYGKYSDFIRIADHKFKSLTSEMTVGEIIGESHINSVLKSQDDVFQFEYSDMDETWYKNCSVMPLEWKDGRLTKVMFVSQDITAVKKLELDAHRALKEAYEAANRANAAKTEFLSNMSHDIRTPMNAIVGMTAIAGAHVDDKNRVLECLSNINQSSRHLLGLINEVLDMARIENKKVSIVDAEFNLSEMVDNVYNIIRPEIASHNHELNVELIDIEHELLYGDEQRIQQILINIFSNAIKYTPDGGKIDFTITEKRTRYKDLVGFEFVVEDNGIGMDEEFQKKIFEPFARADDKRTSSIQGTGLGMSITKNIIDMMRGHIKVESQMGKGSRFTVTLFLKRKNEAMGEREELLSLPVLVVDDDDLSGKSTLEILEEIGVNGEWVESGMEAIDRVHKRHDKDEDYFAIIIDWKMPEMDGIETARHIRKIVGPEVTIIILSAYDISEIEAEARAAGVDDFIVKPLFKTRIYEKLKSLVMEKKEPAPKNPLEDFVNADYKGKRILIVEDNEINSEIAQEIIGTSGADIEIARNGKIALDMVSDNPKGYYNLIFMDIQMPVMDGYEATRAIRSLQDGKGADVPIVAMTANSFVEDVLKAKEAGMNEHVAKPVDMKKLSSILREWL